jgi:hypothetical protein
MQLRHDAGLISSRFPEVSSIVVDMEQRRKGLNSIVLWRTLNFLSGSYAYFHVECLSKDCKECKEGFDLGNVISSMVRSHASSKEGELECAGEDRISSHVNINYKVTIAYNETL